MLKAGRVKMDLLHIKQLLGMPEHWNILGIREDLQAGVFYIGVSGEGLPEVGENELIPEVIAYMEKTSTGIKITKVEKV